MMKTSENASSLICKQIFGTTDILRDCWLAAQNTDCLREIGRLTMNQHRLICTLLRLTENCPEGVPLTKLAAQLDLTGSSVSIMVDGMVERDWLRRVQDQQDRRKVMIRVSDSGLERLARYEKFFDELCEPFFSSISPEDRECFCRILTSMNQYLLKKNQSK